MAFPANMIGIGFGVAAGAYAGYQYSEQGTLSGMSTLISLLLLAVSIFFGAILS